MTSARSGTVVVAVLLCLAAELPPAVAGPGISVTVVSGMGPDLVQLSCLDGVLEASESVINPPSPICHDITTLIVKSRGGDDLVELDGLELGDVSGDIEIFTGGGQDTVSVGAVPTNMFGGAGFDFLALYAGGEVTVDDAAIIQNGGPWGTLESIEELAVYGGPSDDHIDASTFSGRTALFGWGGNDRLEAGHGEKTALVGGEGDDELIGGPMTDSLFGGPGANTLDGGPGLDELAGSVSGTAVLTSISYATGEQSDSFISVERASLSTAAGLASHVDAAGFDGAIQFLGGPGADHVRFGQGVVSARGAGGRDRFIGGTANDSLQGDAGHDLLVGKAGVDSLNGGPGNDTCRGGPGRDRLVSC